MRAFLTAQWRYLLMLSFVVEPELLRPHLPRGVELDEWNNTTLVSLVGFRFEKTRVLGCRAPFHADFEEVNLRFYVRRRAHDGWRRGVVFVKEIVPRRLIAAMARLCYNEPYAAMPMRHRIEMENGTLREGGSVEYGWRHRGNWNGMGAATIGAPNEPQDGSKEEFITEHYWGYTPQRDGRCTEYRVDHPRWKVWQTREAALRCDVAAIYGEKFAGTLGASPESAFVAEGSPVVVSACAVV